MITPLMPAKELLREMREEHPRALYWLRKSLGGDRKYHALEDSLLRDTVRDRSGEDHFSRVIDYRSQKGNRWKVFLVSKSFGRSAHTAPHAFCYWDTYGSVGASVLCHMQGTEKECVLLFTSHFFQRLAERKGIASVDSHLVCAFLLQNYGMMTSVYEKDGRLTVDIRVKDGICRGVVTEMGDSMVAEVRTFLTDKMLSNRQRRETKVLREAASMMDNRPMDIVMDEIFNSKDPMKNAAAYLDNILSQKGMKGDIGERVLLFTGMCVSLCFDITKMDASMVRDMRKLTEHIAEDVVEYVKKNPKEEDTYLNALIFCFDHVEDFDYAQAYRRMFYLQGFNGSEVDEFVEWMVSYRKQGLPMSREKFIDIIDRCIK